MTKVEILKLKYKEEMNNYQNQIKDFKDYYYKNDQEPDMKCDYIIFRLRMVDYYRGALDALKELES